jgi:hypothetical protein
MTVQERRSTWGEQWQERTARPRRDVLDFDAWRPWFVTPRMIAYYNRPRRRSWFIFGGVGMMLFLVFVWAMLFWVVLMTAITWDLNVLLAYAVVLCTVGPVRRFRARRRAAA